MSSLISPQSELAPGSCGCTEEDACTLGNAAGRTNLGQTPSAEPISKSRVLEVAAAPRQDAFEHFSRKLEFETDCSDVHSTFVSGTVDFVLLDVRSDQLYRSGHVPGAVSLPVLSISEEPLLNFPANTNFVVYCAGPHCNGANKAAIRLARLGRPVKEMIGGVTGWLDEGFALEKRS
jgi:rhodanese-related sulfurtransferase